MSEKILVVDDNIVNRKLLVGILKNQGYELLEAEDGKEAIKVALQELPDLILLDIVMPKKDGYEVCVELKSNSQTKNIPIIFLSAKTETKDKVKGLELGGVDYITKPFQREEILARVRTQLELYNLARQLIKANEELMKKQAQIDEDLKAAAEIQKSLLPFAPPDGRYLQAAWKFMPCERVGGDIFNLFRLDEDHWGIYIIDVSGHGVPSAMISVSVSQVMQPQVGFVLKRSINPPPHYEIVPPSKVLTALDKEYPFTRFDRFFTIAYMVLDTRSGILRYSNAAHPPPVLLHQDGMLEFLDKGGTIIGIGGVVPFEEDEKKLKPGDKLFLYTDGITEYQNRSGEFYGEDRFYMELQRLKDLPVSIIVDGIIASMMEFGDNNKPQDDVSLLGLEFKGSKGE